jgi:predicted nucleic acid-binding protein
MTQVILDSNVLLRLSVLEHPTHTVVADAVDRLHQDGHEPVLLPQVIYEFWAVATRTVAANGLGKTPDEVDALIDQFTRWFPVKRDERKVFHHWRALARTYRVSG